nr:RNA-directed DNA polymerase, eukaryota [Tanacetum cinerariifolium]
MIRGVWMKSGNNILIISVYAPHDMKEKLMLWDYLKHVIQSWNGEVVIMGDFNEVRMKSDRFGSVFNVYGANVFNSFIANAGLEEVPLGGCSFTWCHKTATKMGKHDRFLISENLLISCPNITAITLDRYLSDHRPILLRESWFDYGPIPFRFYHHWIEVDGFSCFVKRTWIESPGDENSHFFHGMINKRRSQMRIRGIMIDGVWTEDPSKVKSEFFEHFSSRFAKPVSHRALFNIQFPNTLTLDQQSDLEREVTKEELKKAVWDCGTPPGCNSSFIVLIPKIPDANLVKDFRPISLIGSIYKIIAKLLANRLVGVLGDIINEVQYAFIADRQILDGLFIVNEMSQYCKLKKKQSLIFKVDFEKAFDSIRWDFLDDVFISAKLDELSLADSFRRLPRGGVEAAHSATKWIKSVPIKVNVLAWKIKLDALPTRLNISRRGMPLNSIACPICDRGVESSSHLFFACSLATQLACKISLWWNLSYAEITSYHDWHSWIVSLRLSRESKSILEGGFYVMWSHLWTYRNVFLFDSKKPMKAKIFDDIVSRRSYFLPANTIPRHSRRKNTSIVESEIRTNATIADNRTMAQMLQAPIEGYEDAIVVPPINANNFELKQTLINLVQSNQFTGRQDPHNHLCFFNKVTSTFRHPEWFTTVDQWSAALTVVDGHDRWRLDELEDDTSSWYCRSSRRVSTGSVRGSEIQYRFRKNSILEAEVAQDDWWIKNITAVKNKREKDKIGTKPDQIKKKQEAWRSPEKSRAILVTR